MDRYPSTTQEVTVIQTCTLSPVETLPASATIHMGAIIQRADDAGSHFFSADTMHFFRSRLGWSGYQSASGETFFVTSERLHSFWERGARVYTVRAQGEDGQVRTVGDLGGFSSNTSAKRQAQRLAAKED